MTPLRASVLLAPFLLAACGGSKPTPKTPPRRPDVSGVIVMLRDRNPDAFRDATVLLSGRGLTALPAGAGAARSWTHSPDLRRWTFEIDSAEAWARSWPGPGSASVSSPSSLTVQIDTPDPEFPARLASVAPVNDGPYGPAQSLGPDWRLLSPRAPGRGPLRIGISDDPRESIGAFRAGLTTRLDFIPPDHATALRQDPAFRSLATASTIVLVIDLEESPVRAAVAGAIDAEALCRKALFDPDRAARRLAPAVLGLAEPGTARQSPSGRAPTSLTVAAATAGVETALLLPALRASLRQAGIQPGEPEPGHPARLRLLVLKPGTAALADLFRPLRFLAADHPDIAPLFDSFDSALDPEERANWARALEAALIDARLVVPIAQGRVYSLVRPGSGVELDPWGRYVPAADGAR
ncbi:MAG: hypothetical protein K8T20_20635 [Planctomycetes bacterium]|nr:hypothetical protein [Planctomycetota bacterium]